MPPFDSPREACGVFGISAPGIDIARLAYFAIYALQHRGQEAAGIATCDGKTAHIHKGLGLVSQVFNEDNLHHLKGHLGIGHTRYSTTGSPRLNNTQPYILETLDGPLAIGHNGNLVNAPKLRRELLERGVGLSTSTDSELIIHLLAGARSRSSPAMPSMASETLGVCVLLCWENSRMAWSLRQRVAPSLR